MRLCTRVLLTVAAVATVGACGSSDTTKLAMTLSLGAGAVPGVTNGVKADGSNVVIIQVDGATQAPIKVTTSRGLFTNGMRTLDIAATTGTAELVVCDARTDSGCAGPVIVSASDAGSGVGAVALSFVGYERICNDDDDDNGDGRTDCADPDCDALACVDRSGNAGTCGSLGCVLPVCTPTGSTATTMSTTIAAARSIASSRPAITSRARPGRQRSYARRGSVPISAPASVSTSCRRGPAFPPTAWPPPPSP